MTYDHTMTTKKGHTYRIYKVRGKIVQMNYNTVKAFDVHISTDKNMITVKGVASGLRGYNLDRVNDFKIAISDYNVKYLQSIS